jgi:hypothetical protein
MIKQVLKNKLLVVIVIFLASSLPYSSNAFAWGGHGGHGGHGSYGGHGGYHYRGGRWCDSGWFWGWFSTALVVDTIVATLPPHHDTVYVNGAPYYYYDSIYYRPCPTGYVVVPAPAATAVVTAPVATAAIAVPAVAQPKATSGESVGINIPNAHGGYTPVTLTKNETGYIGPQGEYYEGHPTVKQLTVLYGK